MNTLDISYFGLAVGLLLMAFPLYAFYYFRVGQVLSTLIATLRMVVQLSLIGIYLKYLFLWNNLWLNLLWVLVMVVVAALTITSRTRLRFLTIFFPLVSSLLASALVVGLYFLLPVLHLSHPFDARYFIPIMGILMGNMLGVNVMGLNTYYDCLQREQQLYYYLLGNGATHIEAVTPFVRQALEKSFAPCIGNMAVMGLVSLPGTMIGQILGGSSPDVAIKYQMMIIVITFVASMFSLLITLYLADRRSFDVSGSLRQVRKS